MAATVVPNLTALDPNLADSATGWSGSSGGLDTEVFRQGTGSWTYQTPKNGVGDGNFTPATSVDMSAAGTHIYWMMRCDVMPFCELKLTGTGAPSGLMLKVESAGGSETWHIAGSDTWGGEFRSFVADLSNTSEVYASVGTLDLSAVTKVSWLTDNSNSGNIRIIDNTWLDAPRYGTGLTAYGSDFGYADIEAIDQATANKYGVIELIKGNLIVRGGITIIDNGATTTFNSTGEDITFEDSPVGGDLYKLDFTGTGTTTVIDTLSVKSYGADVNTRFDFDASGTVGSFTMSGSSLNRAALTLFKAGQTVTLSKWNNCMQVRPSTATFTGNSVVATADAAGALLWATSNIVTDVSFAKNITGAAVEHPDAGTFSYTNLDFSDNTVDIHFSALTGDLIINKNPGSNPATTTNDSTGTITIQGSVDFTLTNVITGSIFTLDGVFTTDVPAGVYNGTGDSVLQMTGAIPTSFTATGDVRVHNGSYYETYSYTGVSGNQLTGISPALSQDFNGSNVLLELIAPTTITTDPYTVSVESSQLFEAMLTNRVSITYIPIQFADTTGAGFSRRISQIEE